MTMSGAALEEYYASLPPIAPNEFVGTHTDGPPSSKNGNPFSVPDLMVDGRTLFAVGDLIGYPTGRTFRVSFVDYWTVRMTLNL